MEEVSEEVITDIEELENILKQKFIDNFWGKVKKQPTGCWEWQGSLYQTHPYGQVRTVSKSRNINKNRRAHQVAYMIHNATTLPKGLVIGHECNNARCCNPSHLTAKSQPQNMEDMYKAFRHSSQVKEREKQLEKLIQDLTESERKFVFKILQRQFKT